MLGQNISLKNWNCFVKSWTSFFPGPGFHFSKYRNCLCTLAAHCLWHISSFVWQRRSVNIDTTSSKVASCAAAKKCWYRLVGQNISLTQSSYGRVIKCFFESTSKIYWANAFGLKVQNTHQFFGCLKRKRYQNTKPDLPLSYQAFHGWLSIWRQMTSGVSASTASILLCNISVIWVVKYIDFI